jgi:hypothetical protein
MTRSKLLSRKCEEKGEEGQERNELGQLDKGVVPAPLFSLPRVLG